VNTTLAPLDQPVRGTAQLGADGTLTIGVYADGSPASWPLADGDGRARNALIIGATGAGVSCLLRSVLDGAAAAGAATQLIDLTDAKATGSAHPGVIDLDNARELLARTVVLIHARLAAAARARLAGETSPQPLLVLAVDGLHRLTADHEATGHLSEVLRLAPKARVAVIAAGPDATLLSTGTDVIRAALATDTVVVLRTGRHTTSIPGADVPAIGNQPAGVGHLPRQRPDMPFRAWLP
jgi:hypothetical protein